ncbi:MAG: hypothetical protein ACRD4S_07375 [Candidatus Acidiferrales bacterium]
MRKIFVGFVLIVIVGGAAYLHFRKPKPSVEIAFAGNREVTLWSTSAQVREPIGSVNFGDRLEVLRRFQEQVRVRTTRGVTGWVNERDLLSADLWQKGKDLEQRAAALPIEARGHTRVLGNLHLDPGRESVRIRQLNKDVPVDLFERRAVAIPAAGSASQEDEDASAPTGAKKEDWWLVRANTPDDGPVAGWILGRFVQLDVPEPLPDYASSADMRIVAWFELNRVADGSGGVKPQYLVVGTKGPEGQPCDFTLLRVYTWGKQRARYETAFVESDVCGKLPVKLTRAATAGGDVTFSFEDFSHGAAENRTYRIRGTIVRRETEGVPAREAKHHAR